MSEGKAVDGLADIIKGYKEELIPAYFMMGYRLGKSDEACRIMLESSEGDFLKELFRKGNLALNR